MKTIDPRITDERLPEWKPAECASGRGVTRVLRVSRDGQIGYSLVYEHMDLGRDVLGPVTDTRMPYDWYDAVRADAPRKQPEYFTAETISGKRLSFAPHHRPTISDS